MSHRKAIAGFMLSALFASQGVLAEHDYGYDDYGYEDSYRYGEYDRDVVYARVVDVEPIVRYVTVDRPSRDCWNEVVYHSSRRPHGTAGAVIAGGIIGGVVGHQFGSGRGNDAATLAGTLIGSAIAHDVASQRHARSHVERDTVRRCRVHNEIYREQRIEGYYVTYVYRGREYTTRTRHHPGKKVAVRVSVTPLDG